MKTRVITLNSRSNARFPWPGKSFLHNPRDNSECCIGQALRQCGVPVERMEHKRFPDPAWDQTSVWVKRVPHKIMAVLRRASGPHNVGIELRSTNLAQYCAAHLNDQVAINWERPEEAVEGIRVLFRWVGKQLGEKWVVRYLPPEEDDD